MAYLEAVAAVAGYSYTVPGSDFDSIDLEIKSRLGRRHQLAFQVKCTASSIGAEPDFSFELSRKNYDDLRADPIVPRLLLVVVTPELIGDWIRQSERRMSFRRCGYWLSLRGLPDRSNAASVTVKVPRANLLTPAALQWLMENKGPANQAAIAVSGAIA